MEIVIPLDGKAAYGALPSDQTVITTPSNLWPNVNNARGADVPAPATPTGAGSALVQGHALGLMQCGLDTRYGVGWTCSVGWTRGVVWDGHVVWGGHAVWCGMDTQCGVDIPAAELQAEKPTFPSCSPPFPKWTQACSSGSESRPSGSLGSQERPGGRLP